MSKMVNSAIARDVAPEEIALRDEIFRESEFCKRIDLIKSLALEEGSWVLLYGKVRQVRKIYPSTGYLSIFEVEETVSPKDLKLLR